MRILLGLLMTLGGICGAIVGFLGNVTFNIPYIHPDTMEMSLSFGVFSIIIVLGGIRTLLTTD